MKFPKFFNVTQADLAQQEIEQTRANLQRLDDLAAHHQSLADLYRKGAQAIRKGDKPKVSVTPEVTFPAVTASALPTSFTPNTLSFGAAR